MRKRNIQKIVRLSRDEAQDLQKKAKKACLSEAGLIRLLLRGYEPREKPDERFYDVMRELSAIGNNINQLTAIWIWIIIKSVLFANFICNQTKLEPRFFVAP